MAIIIPSINNIIASPNEMIAASKWLNLTNYIKLHHYKPDIQSIDVILTALTGQFDPHTLPIWLFLIGPSGSGKTTMGLSPLINLPNVTEVSTLTAHTWLSGYIGSKHPGLANRVGSGIVTFPDFTCILALREEARHEVAGHMRVIYDGEAKPENGAMSFEPWKGKITVIAAVTPVIERHWGLLRDMGDRFIQVRWDRLHGPSVAKASRGQQGNEKVIKDTMASNMVDFFTSPRINYRNIPDLSDSQGDQLDNLSELTCILRTQVNREATGNREIRDIPQIEQTGRVGKSLPALVRYHSILHRRESIIDEDINIAKRVAIDSIPFTRGRLITAIPPDDPIGATDLMKLTGVNPSTLRWNMEELEALGVITIDNGSIETSYKMTNPIKEMWKIAFPESR